VEPLVKEAPPRKRGATTEDDITAEVLQRIEGTPDPRLRQIMLALVRHLHAFVKEVNLTEAEWFQGIQFLTDTGHMCSDIRQEFILLSDTLGVSMVVDLLNHRKPEGATESTVFGPFHREGAPEMTPGDDMAPHDEGGTTTIVTGRVLGLDGRPIANALLDVWQCDSTGLYDQQLPDNSQIRMRGKYHTDRDGRFLIRTSRPVAYQIPNDGPVGKLLRATNRHPWRPAHIHIFDSIDPYLESDAVFAVKDSLIRPFTRHDAKDDAAARFGVEPPFCTVAFDFVLKPVRR
jgi:protocatechuate 3,4-dioxygenase beta subunit